MMGRAWVDSNMNGPVSIATQSIDGLGWVGLDFKLGCDLLPNHLLNTNLYLRG